MRPAPSTAPRPGVARLAGSGVASDYARALLERLGWRTQCTHRGPNDLHPDEAWAASGAMALTGPADGPPLAIAAPVAACADGAARTFAAVAEAVFGAAPALDGAGLLGEKAALSDPPLRRAGATSPGGRCHLLTCADGWLALNLARPDDEALLPAWLETPRPPGVDARGFAARAVASRASGPLLERGRLIGLPVAALAAKGAADAEPGTGSPPTDWLSLTEERDTPARRSGAPLVVDLSSLWAGPLCGDLLAGCGARVVKVESRERPDLAREGSPRLFDLLNGRKQSVVLPFGDAGGRRTLAALLRRADVVIESSRPRALRHLGIDAEEIVRERGAVWLSLTGHGRREPAAGWVAFGDDAAIAGGLAAWTHAGEPCFCGDAIADPLAGLHAAAAALAIWGRGRAALLDVSLAGVAAAVRRFPAAGGPATAGPQPPNVQPPRARPPAARAPGLGRDTAAVLEGLGLRC